MTLSTFRAERPTGSPMTPDQYRDAIAALGLSQVRAGKHLGADPRTSRRWASDGAPESVGVALRALIRLKSLGVDVLDDPELRAHPKGE